MRPADIALQWLDAISNRDRDALLHWSHESIAMHGPDGIGVGHAIVSDWFDAMPMRIEVQRLAELGDEVLVHHRIEWLDSDETITDTLENAALIEVDGDCVRSYRRCLDPERYGTAFTTVERPIA